MHRGYVKLHRKALDSGLIQHAKAWQFLSWCLLTATHKPYKRMFNGVLFSLEPGELVTSVSEICAILRMTVKEFRNVQKLLENAEFLASRGTSAGTVFCIMNWMTYQQADEAEGQTQGRARGQARGMRGASSARARSQYIQEEKNKKNDASAAPDALHVEEPGIGNTLENGAGEQARVYRTRKHRTLTGRRLETFEQFWTAFAYPRGKAEAADAWLDIPELTNALVARIVAAAEREAAARPDIVASGRTPKMAQGWISGRRWEDEVAVQTPGMNLDQYLAAMGITQ